jgi:hypothetical protein
VFGSPVSYTTLANAKKVVPPSAFLTAYEHKKHKSIQKWPQLQHSVDQKGNSMGASHITLPPRSVSKKLSIPTVILPTASIGGSSGDRLLIGVVSSPDHFKARQAIRQTWGSREMRDKYKFDVKFFVGELPPQKSSLESRINSEEHMVRLSGFVEKYENLASKALGIFGWGYDNGYSMVFKVDDDSYVRPALLHNFLQQQHDTGSLLAGHIVEGCRNKDNPKSKWYFRDQYDKDVLPTYAIGAGILLGRRNIQYLAEHRKTLVRYRVDDAAVGIWLEYQHPSFQFMKIDVYPYHIQADSIVVNPVNHNEMGALYRSKDGSDVSLQICHDTCLCPGSPNHRDDCFDEFSNQVYKDIVPRVTASQ